MTKPTEIAVLWPIIEPPDIQETRFSYAFCRKTSKKYCRMITSFTTSWMEYGADTHLFEILEQEPAKLLLIVTDPEILLPAVAVEKLAIIAGEDAIAWGPVFNQTRFEKQVAVLRASYLNVSGFLEMAQSLAEAYGSLAASVETLDSACVLIKTQALGDRERSMPLAELVPSLVQRAGLPFRVVKGALVHRFGDYYGGERDDLIRQVPPSVRTVLDVGCAMGGYGNALKRIRPDIFLVGVEVNPAMAERARNIYDRVHTGRIEEINFANRFDLVNCGDVLEHLKDPLKMLNQIGDILTPGGWLVASVPNVGHWSVAKDLLEGTFEYIPVGLLCTTHIYWFTERSLRDILSESGFEVEMLHREKIPPSPKGEDFINAVCKLGIADEQSLRTNEFTVRAIKR